MPAFNFNIGIFGHVDSGKTSLAKVLSTVGSTAAFDSNPQSKERGITLDLGFSSFSIPLDFEGKSEELGAFTEAQITLVDCPGHASLIRTVIGGAQIIDLVLLVVDCVKGVQTQTAECLLLAQITRPGRMVVVLNKIDALPEASRETALQKLEKRFRKTLETTSFKDCQFVRVAANPGGGAEPASNGITCKPVNVEELICAIQRAIYLPKRSSAGQFLMATDHCFPIKGQGTILTGTVLSGSIKIGATIKILALNESRKVKSMQMFKKPVDFASQGDRVALCVTQLEAKNFERGLISDENGVPTIAAAVVTFNRIAYFKGVIKSRSKFHISIGHETVMASCSLFKTVESSAEFSTEKEYEYADEIGENAVNTSGNTSTNDSNASAVTYFLLLTFDHPVLCPNNALYIASKLDLDIHSNTCRLAFCGNVIVPFEEKSYGPNSLQVLKIFKHKSRQGVVDRFMDQNTVVIHSLFKKETNLDCFANMKIQLSTGEVGRIEGGFGQSGKVRAYFPAGLNEETISSLQTAGKKRGKSATGDQTQNDKQPEKERILAILKFRRFIYDPAKRMIQ